jgi:hypothetical protein
VGRRTLTPRGLLNGHHGRGPREPGAWMRFCRSDLGLSEMTVGAAVPRLSYLLGVSPAPITLFYTRRAMVGFLWFVVRLRIPYASPPPGTCADGSYGRPLSQSQLMSCNLCCWGWAYVHVDKGESLKAHPWSSVVPLTLDRLRDVGCRGRWPRDKTPRRCRYSTQPLKWRGPRRQRW